MSFVAFGVALAVLGTAIWLVGAETDGIFVIGFGLGFAAAGLTVARRLV